MIIRVYALYGRNQRILWFLFAVGWSVVGVSVVRFILGPRTETAAINRFQYSFTAQHAGRPMLFGGCHFDLSESTYVPCPIIPAIFNLMGSNTVPTVRRSPTGA